MEGEGLDTSARWRISHGSFNGAALEEGGEHERRRRVVGVGDASMEPPLRRAENSSRRTIVISQTSGTNCERVGERGYRDVAIGGDKPADPAQVLGTSKICGLRAILGFRASQNYSQRPFEADASAKQGADVDRREHAHVMPHARAAVSRDGVIRRWPSFRATHRTCQWIGSKCSHVRRLGQRR